MLGCGYNRENKKLMILSDQKERSPKEHKQYMLVKIRNKTKVQVKLDVGNRMLMGIMLMRLLR